MRAILLDIAFALNLKFQNIHIFASFVFLNDAVCVSLHWIN